MKQILALFFIVSLILIGCRHDRNHESGNENDDILIDSTNTNIEGINFKFFLESSGSMWGYEGPNTDGDFKLAITKMLNTIPETNTGKNLLYIVNDGIHNYDKSYKDFITSGDIFKDIKNIGNPQYTDFKTIFDSIMNNTAPNELSIFVSDLIYSTRDMAEKNSARILGEAEGLTESVFKGFSDLDIAIIKLSSDFNGKYYVYNQPNTGHVYKGKRPYYIMLFASPKVMNEIFTNDVYKEFRNFEGLKNYQDYYLFACKNHKEPFYTILTANEKNRSTSMKAEKNQNKGFVHRVERISPTRSGDFYITVAVDLRNYFMSEDTKTNPDNYVINSKNNFEIDEILPIEEAKISQNEKNLIGTATHLIVLHSIEPKIAAEEVTIEMPNNLPDWIIESSSDDDTKISEDESFSNKTFGLCYICRGIHEAYYGKAETPLYFKLSIKIK